MSAERNDKTDTTTRWLCHVCHFSSDQGSGYVCQRCYKIACAQHIVPVAAGEGNAAVLEMVCVECLKLEKGGSAPSDAAAISRKAKNTGAAPVKKDDDEQAE